MPIVRSYDPKADDVKHQVLTCLGKLLDNTISVETKKNLMDRLTTFLKGKGYDEKAFAALGIKARTEAGANGDRILQIYVPKEYVTSNITEDRDQQWISFVITKATDVENLKGDVAYYEDGKEMSKAQ